jgi:hypothetical protein
MNSIIKRTSIRATLFATALLAAWSFASVANAQVALQGKFSLPYEARWGQAVLPAGDYLLSITSTASPAMVVIQDAKSHQQVAMVAPQTREVSRNGGTALLVGTRGTQRVIHSLRLAELGEVFISDPTLAHGRGNREEARKTQMVPVIVAKR